MAAPGADARKAFVVTTVAGFIAPLEQRDAYASHLAKDDSGAIAAFLDDPTARVLSASVARGASGQLQVRLANTTDFPAGCQYQVTLLKAADGPVQQSDIPHNIRVATTTQSPLASLHRLLSELYCPMLGLAPALGAKPGAGVGSAAAAQQLPPHLQELLLQVVAGLGGAARGGGMGAAAAAAAALGGGVADGGAEGVLGILLPADELDYWAQLAAGPAGTPLAHAAQEVSAALEPLRQPLQDVEAGTIEGGWEGAREACSTAADALRAAWAVRSAGGGRDGWALQQARAQHFLGLVGASLARYCQAKLRSFDLWQTAFGLVKPQLIGAGQLLETWIQECKALMQDWAAGADGSGRKWEGPAWSDTRASQLQGRVEEVFELREVAEQLLALLPADDSAAPAVRGAFAPLQQLRPHALAVGSGAAAAAWRGAVAEFDRRMGAVEARVVSRLKEILGTYLLPSLAAATSRRGADGAGGPHAAAQAQQALDELKGVGALLARLSKGEQLLAERRALVKHIDAYLEQLQSELDDQRAAAAAASAAAGEREDVADAAGLANDGAVLTPIAAAVSWAAQCRAKAAQARDVLLLLSGRSSRASAADAADGGAGQAAAGAAVASEIAGCLGVADELSKELEQFSKGVLEDWQERTGAWLQGMASWKGSRLMSFDAASRHVNAHFSESLVVLLREVRQLQALGVRLRKDITAEVEVASKFYRYGMVLRQCAHFYNTIGSQMIESQKPLMLDDALEFEKVLTAPKDAQGKEITWRSAAALDGYVRRLSEVSDRLAERNRRLRSVHAQLARIVVGLMETDLVRHKDRWAASIKDMRAIFLRLEAEGYPREAQAVWRQHWDFQLAKALEVQFRLGLASITKSLPEVEVRVVLRGGRPCLDPPVEELRLRHYREHLGAFLGLPAKMKGVSDLSERPGFFRWVSDADPAAIARVYDTSEALFARLSDEARRLSDWAALAWAESGAGAGSPGTIGGGDALEALVEEGCSEVAHFEENLRGIKSALRELERLRSEIRVDCYRLVTAPFRAGVEDCARRLRAALASVLRRKALAERQAMEDFVAAGEALLAHSPASAEEIGRAGAEARALVARLGEVSEMRQRVEEKNKLLRQLAAPAAGLAGGLAGGGAGPVDLSAVTQRWDGFTAALHQFDSHLEAQRGRLQAEVARRVDAFRGDVAGFASRWQALRPRGGPGGNPAVVLAQLEGVWAQLQAMQEAAARHVQECEALGVEGPAFPELDALAADVAAARGSWGRYAEFLRERDELARRDWLSMRDQVWKIEDFLSKWEAVALPAAGAAGPVLPGGSTAAGSGAAGEPDAAAEAIAAVLLREIDSYRRCLPHLKTCMRGAGWEDAHWAQLFSLLGFRAGAVTKETVTLAHFLDKADAVAAAAEAIRALDAQAQGEGVIRKALSELRLWGLTREFAFVDPKQAPGATAVAPAAAKPGARSPPAGGNAAGGGRDQPAVRGGGGGGGSMPLIKGWAEVLGEVSDHQALVGSLRQSPYYPLFKDEAAAWESKLMLLQEGLASLNAIQRKWLYLEPIFARGALPGQQGRFRAVDGELRAVMAHLHASRKVLAFTELPSPRERLSAMAAALDGCQRALSDFLEEKRGAFPRFYFLGDDDLLEILGQARSPAVIQAHLRKLFSGIHRVKLSPDSSAITAILSCEGEAVELAQGVAVGDRVEGWLASLAEGMRETLRRGLATAASGSLGAGLFQAAPAQVLGLLHAVDFTARAEAAISSGSLNRLASDLRSQLGQLARADYTGHPLLQAKKQAMIVDLMHACDVAEALAAEPPTAASDWQWSRQLRYYREEPGAQGAGGGSGAPGVVVRMAEAAFGYSWEYQGAAARLVYTPLTDKAYLTMTQALALGYGGNPYGPAGTGKTESVKALGAALGRQVLVFNCDEEFDMRSMGRIFTGLVLCGAWGCFDEFNRLGEDVLSAVSQQIQAIQSALKEGAKSLDFMGRAIAVDANAGIFVTLNPAGKGYGGRSRLPDNLKQLFRPIAMTVPDQDQIAEVLLASEGFAHARPLARKAVALFALTREGCSAQRHYDWGLRALKTAVGAAGQLLRELRKQRDQEVSPEAEAEVAVRAVLATKLPTLTFDDNARFRSLLSDLFPGVPVTDATNPELEAALREAAGAEGLELTQQQVTKALQLQLACDQRIGVIVVGPSGAGKTTLWRLLEAAMAKLGRGPIVYRMNPKALPRHQLLGSLNLDTREWSDGVLTAAARKVSKEAPEQRSWVVCDGDVDPEWIESLNSVLDDNRLLTLPNGERIQFGSNVNFIFECHSLAFASPATVSRCGMIYLSEAAVGWGPQLRRWMSANPGADPTGQLQGWLSELLPRALEWAAARPSAVELTQTGMLASAFSHLCPAVGGCGPSSKAEVAAALARGLGAPMAPEARRELASELASLCGSPKGTSLLDLAASADPLETLDAEDPGATALQRLQQLPSLFSGGGDGSCGDGDSGDALVATESARQVLSLVAPWLRDLQPFLLVGPEGCGKATLLRHCFSRLQRRGGVTVAEVHCSAATGAAQVIDKLLQICGKPVTTATGRALRPEAGRVILLLRDINLPKPDKYGTIQLAELLQQLLAHGGYYDEALEFVRLERVQIIGTLAPASAGRSALSSRLLSRLRVAAVAPPDARELQAVCAQQLKEVCGACSDKAAAAAVTQAPALASALVSLYTAILGNCSSGQGTADVWDFTPRDLSSVVRGLTRYDITQTPVPQALAHEARRVLGDRLQASPSAAAAFERALSAALAPLGRGGAPSGPASAAGGDYYSTLGISVDERVKAAATGSPLRLTRWAAGAFGGLAAAAAKGFEREVGDADTLLGPEALERIAALDRALSAPAPGAAPGGVLLTGACGSGRRALLRLVAHAHGLDVWTPRMARGYGAKAFRADLRELLRSAGGLEGRRRLLLLEDYQLEDPGILEMVNSLLSGGDVPGLWGHDELAKELAPLEAARDADAVWRGPPGAAGLFAYFLHRLKSNLRVAVCLDIGRPELLRARLSANPALTSRCAAVAWQGWGEASLLALAKARLEPLLPGSADAAPADAPNATSDAPQPAGPHLVSQKAVALHLSAAARLGAAPRHFPALLAQYAVILQSKRRQLTEQQSFLQGGLSKLSEAASKVDELGRQAQAQGALLTTKQQEADSALASIQASMEVAAERRKEVEVLRKRLAEDEVALKERRSRVEEQLADVQPILDAARAAVGGIRSDHLSEIRSLRMAPDAIRDVLEGVLLLMGQEDTSWAAMKSFLGKRSVKEDIINYDARRISPSMRTKVDKLLKAKGQSFEKEVIYRASQAAGPMAGWVKANLAYATVLDKVAPLQAQLDSVTASLEESAGRLAQCEAELGQLDGQVARLKSDFQLRVREAEVLRLQLSKAEETLAAASGLLEKLSGERSRWGAQLAALASGLAALPLEALLAAAAVVHLSSQPEGARAAVMGEWTGLLGLRPSFSPLKLLHSESDCPAWQARGLPGEALSLHNGAAVLAAAGAPLIVDPSSRAAEWLKAQLAAEGAAPEVAQLHDRRFPTTLELAVRFGKVLIVTEVDSVEPLLFPLLRKDLQRSGPRAVVNIGDKTVDWNEGFRLFLVTRSPSALADLAPGAAPLLTIANFTVTRSGLEGQLLGLVLRSERPELESQKAALASQEVSLKMELAALEKQLLQALASSSGAILEDASLLASLTQTKAKASNAAAALAEGERLAAALDAQRQAYSPLASKGATLYFAVCELPSIDPMYRFSLVSFLGIFKAALADGSADGGGIADPSAAPADVAARTAALGDRLLSLLHADLCRALLNRHRLPALLHITRALRPEAFPPEQWRLLTGRGGGGGVATAAGATGGPAPAPTWVPEERGAAYAALLAAVPGLEADAELRDASMWGPWVAASPSSGGAAGAAGGGDDVPARVAARLGALTKLLLLKALKPEALHAALSRFVCDELRLPSISPPALSLGQIISASDASIQQPASDASNQGAAAAGAAGGRTPSCAPMLLITTPGADPSIELSEVADVTVGRGRLHEVAMGQGQAEAALQLLRECAQSGGWLVLKNCHLVTPWLPVLEKAVRALEGAAVPGFRLFLTAEAHPRFTPTLLEACTKVTFEAPPGLKQNLSRTYGAWGAEWLARGGPLRAQLAFLLAWFHAVVQERRSYVPQAWTKHYEFSAADLRTGTELVERAAKAAAARGGGAARAVPWRYLSGLLLNVVYGGRVDSPYDTRVLQAHLESVFTPDALPDGPSRARAPLPGLPAALPAGAAALRRGEWLAVISSLPDRDPPAAFGLPANIGRAAAAAAGAGALAALRRVGLAAAGAPGGAGGGGAGVAVDRERWTAQLGPLLQLWDQLISVAPPAVRAVAAAATAGAAAPAPASGAGASAAEAAAAAGPVETFVSLERSHAAAVVGAISAGLSGIKRALDGAQPPAPAVLACAAALLRDAVPDAWDRVWEGPEAPADYVRAAVSRAAAVESAWAPRLAAGPGGGGGALLQQPLALHELFRPAAFLNALRQRSARMLAAASRGAAITTTTSSSGGSNSNSGGGGGCALDELWLASSFDPSRLPPGAGAAALRGLLLQGARLEGGRLVPVSQSDPLSQPLPPLYIAWLPRGAPHPHAQHVTAPLYATGERAAAIAEVQLPVEGPGEGGGWALAGVALVLQEV